MHVSVSLLPGHQLRPTLLIPGPILSQNHRPTLAPIQLHSRRRRILIVHGHVQENAMNGVGGHEDAASHANHLVIETAVTAQVPGIDVSVIRARWRCYLHSVVYARYSIPATILCRSNYGANGGRHVRVYRSSGKCHKQTASDALVFIINATMSLPKVGLSVTSDSDTAPQQEARTRISPVPQQR